jgi:hypothetical protein
MGHFWEGKNKEKSRFLTTYFKGINPTPKKQFPTTRETAFFTPFS